MKKKLTRLFLNRDKSKTQKIIMRLSMFKLVMLLSFLTTYANVNSQTIIGKIKLSEVELSDAFEQIEEVCDCDFIFNYNDVKGYKVSIDLESSSVEACLDELLKGLPFQYKKENELVIISYKKTVPVATQPQSQQKREIKGKVTDEDGNTLPGVSVVVKGTTNGVSTDIDGNYSISIENENAVLVFSFVGMESQEIKFKDQSTINIVLKEDQSQLGEVVVTGYQTISRERATGSFAIVNEKVLDSKISTDFTSRIDGMVSGLQVDREGNMTIRGISTLNASTKPLVVVDGFPIEGDNLSINPNDIKSVNVLKDAAAASIWGVRASNGVVVVITKNGGKAKKPVVSFSYNMTIKDKPDFSSMGYASPADQIDVELETLQNGWVWAPSSWSTSPVSQVADIVFGSANYSPWSVRGKHPYEYITDEEKEKIELLKTQDGVKEYEKYFLRNSVNQQYNLSINGGSDALTYYVSGIFDKNKESYLRQGMDRFMLNSKMDIKLSERVKLTTGVNISHQISTSPSSGPNDYMMGPKYGYGNYLDGNGNYNPFPKGVAQQFKDEYAQKDGFLNWDYNPLQDFRNTTDETETNNYRILSGLNVKLFKGLALDVKYQYEKFLSKQEALYNKENFVTRNSYNQYTGIDPETSNQVHSFPYGEIQKNNDREKLAHSLRTQLNYSLEFGDHSIKALAGWEYRNISYSSVRDSYVGYESQLLTGNIVDWKSINDRKVPTWNGSKYARGYYYKGPAFSETEERYVSAYTNIGYSFASKYDLTFSGRIDDSNLFGADRSYRLLPLWSVGAGWNISKENFFKSEKVNLLKLRMTYGINGNIDRTTVPQMKVRILRDMDTQDIVGEIENPGNPKLKWEKTSVTNLAVDFGFFNNRIAGSIEYYKKISNDLLGEKVLNPLYGYTTIKSNIAELSNKGFELQLNTTPVIIKDFKWDLGVNFSYNKNSVVKAYSDARSLRDVIDGKYIKTGRPIDAGYAYRYAGLSETGTPLVYNKEGEKVDQIANVVENVDDLKYVGATIAPYNGSINTSFSYKGFNLNMLFTGSFGHYFKMAPLEYNTSMMLDFSGNLISNEAKDRWRKEGDEMITNIPKVGGSPWEIEYDYFNNSDYKVKPADYISFKEVVLSYQFNKECLSKLPFSSIVLSAQARNLGKWVKNDQDIDPETRTLFAYGSMSMPTQKSFSIGLKATF